MGNYSISNLVTNDIISYAVENTSSNHSLIYLDSVLEDYNEEAQQYIRNHLDEIIQDLRIKETVKEESKIYYDEDGKLIFDLYFKEENLFNSMENEIKTISAEKGAELDFDEIKTISSEFTSSDEYKNLLDEYVDNKLDMGKEL